MLQIQLELEALSVEGANYSLEDQLRKAQLEEQLAEQQDERAEFLYEHEVDVRKEALDKEQEAFEEKINSEIKAIENMLDREGAIRQQAVDLINGQTQEFYNNLLDYTLTYTDKSRAEFQNLWDKAYEALRKYGNGVIDVDSTLAFLIASIDSLENQMNELEDKINSAKETATQFTDGFSAGVEDVEKQFKDLIATMEEAEDEANKVTAATNTAATGHSYWTTPDLTKSSSTGTKKNYTGKWAQTKLENNLALAARGQMDYEDIFKFHDGGLVPHQGITKNAEVFAKLLAGEVVVTQDQASNFFKNTLPKLANASTITNQSNPTITIGDINISGNADAATVAQLKEVQQEIVNDVFKTINNQKNVYSGSRIR